jgi:hypothetical protein
MCTVTLFPQTTGGIRLVCNRDELRNRPLATPTQLHVVGQMRFLAPLDPLSQGTWIGVNQVGLAMCLLNRNVGWKPPSGTMSRGSVIPALMQTCRLGEALAAYGRLELSQVAPFRLIITDGRLVAEVMHTPGDSQSLRLRKISQPLLYTSSSLGDGVVTESRGGLLCDWLLKHEPSRLVQDQFHRHAWPDRPEHSVMMQRPDAQTVSVTEITLEPRRVEMNYYTVNDSALLPVSSHTLTFRREPQRCQSSLSVI